ncbi:ornithine carbamoyltransferase [Candida albicans P57072]|uniref:ornithine carbamoyltransferase n=3 Tax=Candida albicans TaxID=5476 RepID=Q5ABU0_CANAL|nr:ornithine carbamoyltransferase [Candida albicans SC5314]KAF6070785.1 ornithine carbamoyltransferase [Candida albicans]KGQ84305.1 ornithine carbamoyltransferase [Candida albicans P94015]KGQ86192.1 ornithine carbamoyltransferase [Candida albicans P37005]KGR05061.1 ornithine carbamoyltransferase [Candida albicans P57072]KGR10320.1 ornithine carbamoyltransferase [Candida albicans P37037]KGT65804.1 ornithine carbamoyltransferase [Candida albicans 12C]KGU05607.1 ornithine carbamoyltransferase [|eukprot:XP_719171.1 ornithine carbamoyltransferase [Candida albicans SC5314]
MMSSVRTITTTRLLSTTPIKATASSQTPRHLINIAQLTNDEFSSLINKAYQFKQLVKSDKPSIENHQKLLGKLVALLFTKRSTRTRISTEGAASFFGAQPMFLGKDDIQLGVNESMYDTTKVISSMTSCIFARVNKHQDILDLCQHSSVPIVNSLCDKYHPLQAIADLLTIKEQFGDNLKGLKLTWIGDANNVINDLSIACLKLGINVSISIPKDITFDQDVVEIAEKLAKEQNLTFEIVNDPIIALNNANIVVTDTWISMGEEEQKLAKLKQFQGYQITQEMCKLGKVNSNWKFMHCLPRHQEEVADDVFYSDNSVVFEEAENRLYAAMAVIDGFVINKGDLLK